MANLRLDESDTLSSDTVSKTNMGLANRVATGASGGSYLNAKRLGSSAPIPGVPTGGTAKSQGLRSNLLERPKYDEGFARNAKRIYAKRGLTVAQRAAQMNSLKSSELMRQYGISPDSDQGKQVVDLNRAANRKGLTKSQRVGLADVSNDILDNSIDPIDRQLRAQERKQAMTFEDALAKKLGINLEDSYDY